MTRRLSLDIPSSESDSEEVPFDEYADGPVNQAPSSNAFHMIRVRHLSHHASLIVILGIDSKEIARLLRAALHTDAKVIGLRDERNSVVYPLSVLCLAPDHFRNCVYDVVLDSSHYDGAGAHAVADESDQYDDDTHSTHSEAPVTTASSASSTSTARHPLVALSSVNITDLLAIFDEAASNHGLLDRAAFARVFARFLPALHPNDVHSSSLVGAVLMEVFDLFDRDGSGEVDFDEFAGGLALLVHGQPTDKARLAFFLFDSNRDGFIALDEMFHLLDSLFTVVFRFIPQLTSRVGGASAEELALATARQCFAHADLNRDDLLSFEEFCAWYSQPTELPFLKFLDSVSIPRASASTSTAEPAMKPKSDDLSNLKPSSKISLVSRSPGGTSMRHNNFFTDAGGKTQHSLVSLPRAQQQRPATAPVSRPVIKEDSRPRTSRGVLTSPNAAESRRDFANAQRAQQQRLNDEFDLDLAEEEEEEADKDTRNQKPSVGDQAMARLAREFPHLFAAHSSPPPAAPTTRSLWDWSPSAPSPAKQHLPNRWTDLQPHTDWHIQTADDDQSDLDLVDDGDVPVPDFDDSEPDTESATVVSAASRLGTTLEGAVDEARGLRPPTRRSAPAPVGLQGLHVEDGLRPPSRRSAPGPVDLQGLHVEDGLRPPSRRSAPAPVGLRGTSAKPSSEPL